MLTRQRNNLSSDEENIPQKSIVLCCSVESIDGPNFKYKVTDQNENTIYIAIKRKKNAEESFSKIVERKSNQGNDSGESIGEHFIFLCG